MSYSPLALGLSLKKSWHSVVRHQKCLSVVSWSSSIGYVRAAGLSSRSWGRKHSYARRSHTTQVCIAASCVGVELSVQVAAQTTLVSVQVAAQATLHASIHPRGRSTRAHERRD